MGKSFVQFDAIDGTSVIFFLSLRVEGFLLQCVFREPLELVFQNMTYMAYISAFEIYTSSDCLTAQEEKGFL